MSMAFPRTRSTTADMSQWMRFLLAGGVTESGQRLVNLTTLGPMFNPQFTLGMKYQSMVRKPYFPGAMIMADYGFTW
jgi:CubicO group peptidase (beta-lactamase class C family)